MRIDLLGKLALLSGVGVGVFAGGPDPSVGHLFGITRLGLVGDRAAFGWGTEMCNLGDGPVAFNMNTDQHPILIHNLYRAHDGRFEQIGLSWASHLMAGALNHGVDCGACSPGPAFALELRAGCSTSDSGSYINSQLVLGPRSEVSPFGDLVFPFSTQGQTGDALYKRLQVALADLDPANYPGAEYFIETQLVTGSEAAGVSLADNCTSMRVAVGGAPASPVLASVSGALPGVSALEAWAASDPNVLLSTAEAAGEARIQVASRATEMPDGWWRYEYTVHNRVSLGGVAAVRLRTWGTNGRNFTFAGVSYHSGEPYDDAPWTGAVVGDYFRWETATFDENPNANALRWGTAYRFGFESAFPPMTRALGLEAFGPQGLGASGRVQVLAPDPGVPLPVALPDLNCDGVLSVSDISAFVLAITDAVGYAAQFPECSIGLADTNYDGVVSVGDISCFVAALTAGEVQCDF